MTIAEFKAWLEGFEHSFKEQPVSGAKIGSNVAPTAAEWLLIKEKLALVGIAAIAASPSKNLSDYYQSITAQNNPFKSTSAINPSDYMITGVIS